MSLTKDLLTFLSNSPTAWHAIEEVRTRLLKAGLHELKESDSWKIKKGQSYFVVRGGASLIAFKTPTKEPSSALVMATHTDSPAFKLKPNAEFVKENMLMLGLEVYGSPMFSSWLNRDLGIAGKVAVLNRKGSIEERLVRLDNLALIPQLAIHLDRKVNEEGPQLNKQEHLAALFGICHKKEEKTALETLLKKKFDFEQLLSHDLFLFPQEKPSIIGVDDSFVAGYRLDSLASLHAILEAFIGSKNDSNEFKMAAFWDHEEIGSRTAQGASSPFFPHTLERILLGLGYEREAYLRLLSGSLCISVDLAHAANPNYLEKHEPRHRILLNEGVVLKQHAQQAYASTASSSARLLKTAFKQKIPIQKFVTRGDIPAGSTVGPIHATLTGMATVDIGIPQLSMHSARELIAVEDHIALYKLLKSLY